MTVTVDEFDVADPADAWTQAGFTVDTDDVCRVGDVRIRLVGRGRERAGGDIRPRPGRRRVVAARPAVGLVAR